jgi:hypothetical protein
VAVAYALTPQGVQHGHSIREAGLTVRFALSPASVRKGHTTEESTLNVSYLLAPKDAIILHTVGEPTLAVIGNATRVEVEASSMYSSQLSANQKTSSASDNTQIQEG